MNICIREAARGRSGRPPAVVSCRRLAMAGSGGGTIARAVARIARIRDAAASGGVSACAAGVRPERGGVRVFSRYAVTRCYDVLSWFLSRKLAGGGRYSFCVVHGVAFDRRLTLGLLPRPTSL